MVSWRSVFARDFHVARRLEEDVKGSLDSTGIVIFMLWWDY